MGFSELKRQTSLYRLCTPCKVYFEFKNSDSIQQLRVWKFFNFNSIHLGTAPKALLETDSEALRGLFMQPEWRRLIRSHLYSTEEMVDDSSGCCWIIRIVSLNTRWSPVNDVILGRCFVRSLTLKDGRLRRILSLTSASYKPIFSRCRRSGGKLSSRHKKVTLCGSASRWFCSAPRVMGCFAEEGVETLHHVANVAAQRCFGVNGSSKMAS